MKLIDCMICIDISHLLKRPGVKKGGQPSRSKPSVKELSFTTPELSVQTNFVQYLKVKCKEHLRAFSAQLQNAFHEGLPGTFVSVIFLVPYNNVFLSVGVSSSAVQVCLYELFALVFF